MSVAQELRVACVGAGYFSQFHYRAWERIGRVRVVGACDHDIGKATATGHPPYADPAAMLAATAPDLLDVIVPPAAQAGVIRTALAAGTRAIVCQKPFCRDLAEAKALVAEAEAAGATLIVHDNFRFQPWHRAIGRALGDGLVGELLQVTFRLRPGDGQGRDAYLNRQPNFFAGCNDFWCTKPRCTGSILSAICWGRRSPSMPICAESTR